MINKDKLLLNLIPSVQWQHTKSVLTPISDFFLLSEVVTMQQTDSTAHKLKSRLFHESAYLWAYLADFHPWCELCLTSLPSTMTRIGTIIVFHSRFRFSEIAQLLLALWYWTLNKVFAISRKVLAYILSVQLAFLLQRDLNVSMITWLGGVLCEC